ncbi:hypothetical protein ACTPOE_03220 [Castellaniella sp. WN]
MGQNDTSTSLYKAGATIMLDAWRTYFTHMERLRDVQRRTDAEFADAAARCAGNLKNAGDLAQCASWQQQAYAEQIGRWNQYMLELIQAVLNGQATTQAATRDGLEQIRQAYMALAMHIPHDSFAGTGSASSANRKSGSQRASVH